MFGMGSRIWFLFDVICIRLLAGTWPSDILCFLGWGLVSMTRKYLIFAGARGFIYEIELWGPQGVSYDIPRVTLKAHVLTWTIVKYWETLDPIPTAISLPVLPSAPRMLTLKSTVWYIFLVLIFYLYLKRKML